MLARILSLYNYVILDTILDALASSFFPDAKGYGGLSAVRHAGSYIKETFNAYGSIDAVDNKRCSEVCCLRQKTSLTYNIRLA